MALPVLDGPSLIGEPVHANMNGLNDSRWFHSPVEYSIAFHNQTDRPVVVSWRNGLKTVIPGNINFRSPAFTVKVTMEFIGDVKENVKRILSVVNDDSPVELIQMRKSLESQTFTYGQKTLRLFLDYPIDLDKVDALGGSTYCHELDLMLSTLTEQEALPHPYSEEGRRRRLLADVPADFNKATFGFYVRLVDNTGTIGVKYVNYADHIYRVDPIKDPTMRNGVYIVATQPSITDLSEKFVKDKYYPCTPEAFRTLGLYDTYADAASFGDRQTSKKSELIDLEHRVQVSKQEAEQLRIKLQLEAQVRAADAARAEDERRRLEAELKTERDRIEHLMTLERLRKRDEYEERSANRKDSSDALKIIPTIIIGVGSAIAALMALGSRSK